MAIPTASLVNHRLSGKSWDVKLVGKLIPLRMEVQTMRSA